MMVLSVLVLLLRFDQSILLPSSYLLVLSVIIIIILRVLPNSQHCWVYIHCWVFFNLGFGSTEFSKSGILNDSIMISHTSKYGKIRLQKFNRSTQFNAVCRKFLCVDIELKEKIPARDKYVERTEANMKDAIRHSKKNKPINM